MFLVIGNSYYNVGHPIAYSETKKTAESALRKAGYKFNSRQEIFLNEFLSRWASISEIEEVTKVFQPKEETA